MSVKPIIASIDSNKKQQSNQNSIKINQSRISQTKLSPKDSVAFTGLVDGMIVNTMNFIEQGGYAASFIIQDGLGFIAPRVGKGLFRGSKQYDENGNPILDENGKQKRELNWQLARKEFLREIITGPSAFLIPMAMFAGIKKWGGEANNVKTNYIEGFKNPFIKFANENSEIIKNGTELSKEGFYKNVYENVIEESINKHLPDAEKMSHEEVITKAKEFAKRQILVENISGTKEYKGFWHRKARAQKFNEIGGTVDDLFMALKKEKIGGAANELAVEFQTSQGNKGGSIHELGTALNDYYDDALKNLKKALGENLSAENIENTMKSFTKRRMGTRILSNLGIFSTVALFYTQIPKLYNYGLKGNPALKGTAADKSQKTNNGNPSFTGNFASAMEKAGDFTFKNPKLKKISDIFEFDGNVISGAAMPVLLYGFCIPPRLKKAGDKYDFGEVIFRDMISFTALLFGAKALARGFSDIITKATGLALNKKDLEGKNFLQKTIAYFNPLDSNHSVLNTQQLTSKYTNIEKYKDGVNGFIKFIEDSKGNIKKAFAQDSELKGIVEEIVKKYTDVTSYADAKVSDIKNALNSAKLDKDGELIKKFNQYFANPENKLLRKAKTWNSTFGFVSTILLIPSLIIWIASKCEKMTANRVKEDLAEANKNQPIENQTPTKTKNPTMAGFLCQSQA